MDGLTWRREGAAAPEAVYSVGELTRDIRALLEDRFGWVSVRGEVSNLSRPQSGHLYFSLVDDGAGGGSSRFTSAQLPVVLWRSAASRLRFRLEGGMKVVASGRLSVYEPRGAYQLVAERLIPEGVGELQLAFEQLKAKLEAEGLFAPERKRALPFSPRCVGLVTSPSGAAIRDFLTVLYERSPSAWVRLIPVRVQGAGAAEEIAAAIERFGGASPPVEVVVVTRGGGSLEDLWAFNEEVVARAIARSRVPTVSAVGHEIDFTIADFVADQRAPTPTAAAKCVAPDATEVGGRLRAARRSLVLALRGIVDRSGGRLDRAGASRFLRDPQLLVEERLEAIDDAAGALENGLYNHWRQWNDVLFTLAARLEGLSPFSVLARGYSVTTGTDGRVIRSASQLERGEPVLIRLAEGRVRATVEETSPGPQDEEGTVERPPGTEEA